MHPERYSRWYEALLLVALVLVIVASEIAAAAEAAPQHPHKAKHHKPHCKANQRLRRKVVKVKGKRTTKLVCVKKRTAKTAPKSSGRIPHSHLDPSFEQNPLNPYSTTWHYSASATEEVTDARGAVQSFAAPLPEGTLSFFVNGSLECAVNVGPGNEASACDVTLTALGPQKVTTTYSSGSLSSTETEVDNVEPVTATLSLVQTGYEAVANEPISTESKIIERPPAPNRIEVLHWERVGWIEVHGAVSIPSAANLSEINAMTCPQPIDAGCFGVARYGVPGSTSATPILDAEGNGRVGVELLYNEAREVVAATIEGDGYGKKITLAELADGSHYLTLDPAVASGYSVAPARLQLQIALGA